MTFGEGRKAIAFAMLCSLQTVSLDSGKNAMVKFHAALSGL